MTETKDYEREANKNIERNEEFLNKFEEWLKNKNLTSKTIKNHINNVDLYINQYLNYYEICSMEDGCMEMSSFLGDWFIRKCMWSTASSVKSTAASIKKFYLCMNELGLVDKDSYDSLCETIKLEMDDWIEEVEEYNSDSWYY